MNLYLTGGTLRDKLLGVTGKADFDFAVEAESFEAMLAGLTARGFVAYLGRPEFVTVRGRLPLANLGAFDGLVANAGTGGLHPVKAGERWVDADFTLCRAETMYSDKRHPDTVTPCDLRADLGRRDFTVNALAVSEHGQWFDAYGGRTDAHNRTLRTVGRAVDRFTEDPLRMLRAVRFEVTCGLWPAHELTEALRDADVVDLLATLPVERVHDELNKALRHNWRSTMLAMLVRHPLVGDTLYSNFPSLWLRSTKEAR